MDELANQNMEKITSVTMHDMPISCPMPNQTLWDSHPKVFIHISDKGKGCCPYCGTEYIVTDWDSSKAHH